MQQGQPVQLVLCIGGNLGDQRQVQREATTLLERALGRITKMSQVYSSPPWGFESEMNFWNQVICLETALNAESILHKTQTIEAHFGQKVKGKQRYSSRVLDVDLLFYDRHIIRKKSLTVPHPHIEKRAFVLVPLAEVLPNFKHPTLGFSTTMLLDQCPDKSPINPW